MTAELAELLFDQKSSQLENEFENFLYSQEYKARCDEKFADFIHDNDRLFEAIGADGILHVNDKYPAHLPAIRKALYAKDHVKLGELLCNQIEFYLKPTVEQQVEEEWQPECRE